MCFLGLFHAYAMRACLSITMTEMVVPIEPEELFDDSCKAESVQTNTTNVTLSGGSYEWSEYTQVKRHS